MARLFVLSGPDVGRSIELHKTCVMGRSPDCEVRLRDTSVSREHARLENVGGCWTVVDLDSRNGLSAGGERIARLELEDGTVFHLGELELRFRLEAAPKSSGSSQPKPQSPNSQPASPPPSASPSDAEESLQATRMVPPPADDLAAAARELLEEDPPDDEIVLEGDWDDSVAPVEPVAPVRDEGPSTPAAKRGATEARRAAAAPAAGKATDARRRAALVGGRPVLQYNTTTDREGFFAEDLAQQPLWIRLGVYLLVAAVFGAVAWGAFRLTQSVKGRASGGAVEQSE